MSSPESAACDKNEYLYRKLEPQDAIRILALEPEEEVNIALRGTLLSMPISAAPSYEAVSYTWGDACFPQTLYLTDGFIKITDNLAAALRDFRLRHRRRWLWIDAICINQSDLIEKGHQVARMASIYKQAEQVLVWLGERNENTDRAIDYFERIAASAEGYGIARDDAAHWLQTPQLRNANHATLTALLEEAKANKVEAILSRPWFTRLWICQEIALASKAILHCGARQFTWVDFATAVVILWGASSSPDSRRLAPDGFNEAWRVVLVRARFRMLSSPGIFVLSHYDLFGFYMNFLRFKNCKDDRDHVYGLLSLKHPDIDIDIRPDYTKPTFEVYIDFARKLLESGDLEMIYHAGICRREILHRPNPLVPATILPSVDELPSWVPDFRRPKKHLTQDYVWEGDGTNRKFRAGLGVEPRVGIVTGSPRKLVLSGYLVDSIDFQVLEGDNLSLLDEVFPFKHTTMFTGLSKRLFDQYRPLEGYGTGEDPELVFARTIMADGCSRKFDSEFESIHPESRSLELHRLWKLYAKHCLSEDGEIRTQEEAFGSGWKRPSRFYDRLSEDAQQAFKYELCLEDNFKGTQFILSKKRRLIGLAPRLARVGDYIAIVHGACVPFVVRFTGTIEGLNEFILVGSCYVHGIMEAPVGAEEVQWLCLV